MRKRRLRLPDSGRSIPGVGHVGSSSPVLQSLNLLRRFFAAYPEPDLGKEPETWCGALTANHLIQLVEAAGLLNVSGRHSAAMVLIRSLEDSLDCFTAITLVTGVAQGWIDGRMKPSDAAKKWTSALAGQLSDADRMKLEAYRKSARGQFAKYSHCTYELCGWDVYWKSAPHPVTGETGGIPFINHEGLVISSNAHAIDAHLTAHLLEFMDAVRRAYSKHLHDRPNDSELLDSLHSQIVKIMEEHSLHLCQNILTPAELRRGQSESTDSPDD